MILPPRARRTKKPSTYPRRKPSAHFNNLPQWPTFEERQKKDYQSVCGAETEPELCQEVDARLHEPCRPKER
jgi:hypothetical protein